MVGSGNPFVNDTSTAAPGPRDRLRRRMPPNPFLSNRHQAVAEDGLGRRHPGPATEQGMARRPPTEPSVSDIDRLNINDDSRGPSSSNAAAFSGPSPSPTTTRKRKAQVTPRNSTSPEAQRSGTRISKTKRVDTSRSSRLQQQPWRKSTEPSNEVEPQNLIGSTEAAASLSRSVDALTDGPHPPTADTLDYGRLILPLRHIAGPSVALSYQLGSSPSGSSQATISPYSISSPRDLAPQREALPGLYRIASPDTSRSYVPPQARPANASRAVATPPAQLSKLPLPGRPSTKAGASWASPGPKDPSRMPPSPSMWKGKGRVEREVIPDLTVPTIVPSGAPLDTSRLPVEIFDLIVSHLSRTDIKAMRLVDRTFYDCVSPRLFRNVVVPFNPKVYGRLGELLKINPSNVSQQITSNTAGSIDLDIFPGFGEHIRQFGMTFDLDQHALANPPTKNLQEDHGSFWGDYEWPFRYYRRFEDRAELEVAADETQMMKQAFSYLKNTHHLGLALDCGLGWLNGPDMSIRARVLNQSCKVFGQTFHADNQTLSQRALWQYIESAYRKMKAYNELKISELVRGIDDIETYDVEPQLGVACQTMPSSFVSELNLDLGPTLEAKFKEMEYGEYGDIALLRDHERRRTRALERHGEVRRPRPWTVEESFEESTDDGEDQDRSNRRSPPLRATTPPIELIRDDRPMERGLLYTRSVYEGRSSSGQSSNVLLPGQLTDAQKEWLLETAWAQEAFLSSYMIAVTDNQSVFNITKLTLTRFSSRHVPKLCRGDFWEAMSGLTQLDLKVVADYRDVVKTQAGFAAVNAIEPSQAVNSVHHLLQTYVSRLTNLESLSVGWQDGGEHAEGVFARNRLLLPAPILLKSSCQSSAINQKDLLCLPHLQHFELVNCWITPNALEAFIVGPQRPKLRSLTLTSVSLTMHPRFRGHQWPAAQHLQAMVANHLAAHGAANPGPNPPGVAYLMQQLHNFHAQNPAVGQLAPVAAIQHLMQHVPQALLQHQAPPLPAQQPPQPSNQPRVGSWAHVLGNIRNSSSREMQDSFELKLLSCGYTRLASATFDQSLLEQTDAGQNLMQNLPAGRVTYHATRRTQLRDFMIHPSDGNLGTVMTALPAGEMADLSGDWSLQAGWPTLAMLGDGYEDDGGWGKWGAKTKEGPEFDGGRIGGSGRFSGRITHWVPLREEAPGGDAA